MALAIAILVVAALLIGFFALTSLEAKRGRRLFARSREALDARAAHAFEVARHVDPGPLAFHALQAGLDHFVHEVVHLVLFAVRILERFLTRAARYLRGRRAEGTADARTTFAKRVERIRSAIKKEGEVTGVE